MPKGIVESVLRTLKGLTRSKIDRSLLKHQLEDEDGHVTKAGRVLVVRQFSEELWQERRKEIATQLMKADKQSRKKDEDEDEDDE